MHTAQETQFTKHYHDILRIYWVTYENPDPGKRWAEEKEVIKEGKKVEWVKDRVWNRKSIPESDTYGQDSDRLLVVKFTFQLHILIPVCIFVLFFVIAKRGLLKCICLWIIHESFWFIE